MTIEDLGNIGDLLGGIGVVATLIYLAIQIRHNTRQLQSDSVAARTIALESGVSDIAKWISTIVENRDVAELWQQGLSDIEALDEIDRLRFDYLGTQLLQSWQTARRRSNQLGDLELWQLTLRYIKLYLRNESFQDLWSRSRVLFEADFVEEIEKEFPTVARPDRD